MVSDQSHLLDTWPFISQRAIAQLLALMHILIFPVFWCNASLIMKNKIFQLQGLLCDILAGGPCSISKLFELLPLVTCEADLTCFLFYNVFPFFPCHRLLL